MNTMNRLNNLNKMSLSVLAVWVLVVGATGCVGMQGQSTIDAITGQAGAQPFVEAYIEYGGPNEKWSGPAPVIVHVLAKDSDTAQIKATPPMFAETGAGPTVSENRLPASEQGAHAPAMSSEKAREQMGALAMALTVGQQGFAGCLYPVRVRLIRGDGSLVEKHGCRGQSGWAHAASEIVSGFLKAASDSADVRRPASDSK